ncbi:MAG TPA: hypothetical protein VKB80_19865 [Kofleriaceae bacterium]|nr:hypothetical protein [Kofleriaceae bacterium]
MTVPTTTMTLAAVARAALLAALVAQAGCYGDLTSTREDPSGGAGDGSGDGGGGNVEGPDAAPIPDGADLTCAGPASATEDGHHYPGMACATCHDGSIGPTFTVGGTLYADAAGTQAVAGVTVTVIDADQNRIDLVSGQNGNFWTDQAVTFPVTAFASSCPDVAPMTTQAGSGNCNAGGCHAAGAAITFAP